MTEFDESLAELEAHADWKLDTKSTGSIATTMTYHQFFDSMYQLTDLWCEDIGGQNFHFSFLAWMFT